MYKGVTGVGRDVSGGDRLVYRGVSCLGLVSLDLPDPLAYQSPPCHELLGGVLPPYCLAIAPQASCVCMLDATNTRMLRWLV